MPVRFISAISASIGVSLFNANAGVDKTDGTKKQDLT